MLPNVMVVFKNYAEIKSGHFAAFRAGKAAGLVYKTNAWTSVLFEPGRVCAKCDCLWHGPNLKNLSGAINDNVILNPTP
jgi:hypothetical protein